MEAPEVEAPAAALGAEKGLECLAAPCLAPALGAACALGAARALAGAASPLAGAACALAGAASALAGAACALASSTFLDLLDALQK